ncbi:MAG: hypothetical protein HW407_2190 [Bacteroidetes bacterium]|nr:hypothetical protein [Bacteroidota bacterium]
MDARPARLSLFTWIIISNTRSKILSASMFGPPLHKEKPGHRPGFSFVSIWEDEHFKWRPAALHAGRHPDAVWRDPVSGLDPSYTLIENDCSSARQRRAFSFVSNWEDSDSSGVAPATHSLDGATTPRRSSPQANGRGVLFTRRPVR